MKAVLAATADGRVSYCTCPPELRGTGRCNHVIHQEEGESESAFMDRVCVQEDIVSYKMEDSEKENLQEIKGRTDLADENCEGGYIHLDSPVWSPSNLKEFSELSRTKESLLSGMIMGKVYYDTEEGKLISIVGKDKAELAKQIKADKSGRYITGVDGLNQFAEEKGYEATTDIYVLPYYMRQNTGDDVINPINTLYNAVILQNNATNRDTTKLQAAYERLLDNKNVGKHGFKPLTKHGGYPIESLADLVNGKSGIMRGYITGFSIPYSGRAVISPNIHMKYGEVGIPASMAVSIFEPTVRQYMRTEGNYTEDDINGFIDRVSKGKGDTIDKFTLDKILTQEDRKVLVNRQPSLHMGSMVCFKARITEVVDNSYSGSKIQAKDIIQLNPMLAKGFNADFDGDTQAIYALNDRDIGNDAWSEMSPFTEFVSNNPKNMKESMTVPTKDCLFGLLNILGVSGKK